MKSLPRLSLSSIPKRTWLRVVLMALMDALLCNLAMLVAQQLRFDVNIPDEFFARYLNLIPVMTLLCVLSFFCFHLYSNLWRYASMDNVVQIVAACFCAALSLYIYSLFRFTLSRPANHHLLHRTVYVIYFLMLTALTCASRLIIRIVATRGLFSFRRGARGTVRRAMIIGAGWTGASVVKDMQAGRYGACVPVLVVDDDQKHSGRRLCGVPVRQGTGNVRKLATEYNIDDIIVAIATPGDTYNQLLTACMATGCRVRRMTGLSELREGEDTHRRVRNLDIGDLLGRPEKRLDNARVRAYFSGKTVLVTGGGGSIGSEICRQLLAFDPKRVVLYDINENYMYDLFFDMQAEYGADLRDKLLMRVGSVRDAQRLMEVMDDFAPEVVIHAAAHKHVPLMEDSPSQAVKNNVFGTWEVAQAAIRAKVKRFVMISTDKAVNPTNVMGATKRMAEMIVEALGAQSGTEFTAVRFGNVLGSHGSVVPLFERQILAGGPVTLTHPDVIRYFMTIPEAAGLVLQAASVARGGELFVLDMGQPVRIGDLAEHMIKLYGDGRRIPIVCTGLRPGEKLYEELLMDTDGIVRTDIDRVFVAKPEAVPLDAVQAMLDRLRDTLDANGDVRACLHELLPTYREAEAVNEAVVERVTAEPGAAAV